MIYRRTASGDEALHSVDDSIPVDYRRILCLVNEATHLDVIRGRLRQYSDGLIADWVAELIEIGFIESAGESATYDLDFNPLASNDPPVAVLSSIPAEEYRIQDEARVAGAALKDKGVYLASARLDNRAPLQKQRGEIVVLLVEDDPDQAALADLRLSMAGYKVRLARNVREMVDELTNRSLPDVVVLDVMLPDGNGFGILACMRTDAKLSLVPVIMLTALDSSVDVQRGLDLGADGYLTKPYSKEILADAIKRVLRHP